MSSAAQDGTVTVVTQTRVRPDSDDLFSRWQGEISRAVAKFPGFLEQRAIPPTPPGQVDWVILQRFASAEAAARWLNSGERFERVEQIAPVLIGLDDVHVVRDGGRGAMPAPVSAVISSRVKPGKETAYRQWERRMAAAQAKAPGFQGYRFEPPVPGVQEDWLAILRFDTEANLQGWLDSPERRKLLEEGKEFHEEFHARIVHTGFDQWFPVEAGDASPPARKQNMLVLLMLFPVVFLFGAFVQVPLLQTYAGVPFPVALFIGNAFSVTTLNYLVPWVSRRFGWWLRPSGPRARLLNYTGTGLVIALYALMIFIFTRLM
jgi:antibiotic biosynthesis monooxygenase (ABM) superfamily enzyme